MADQPAWLNAFVLHTRKYTDNRLILDLFTLEYGRMSAVIRLPKKQVRSDLQVCQAVSVTLIGRGALKTVTQLETAAFSVTLQGKALFCALYLNELIQRLLSEQDDYPQLFILYQHSLQSLADSKISSDYEAVLRHFELSFLADLGFGMDYTHCADTGRAVEKQKLYTLDFNSGFIENTNNQNDKPSALHISGETLLAIHHHDFSCPNTLKEAKKLCRVLLRAQLGGKPLKSRELFI